MLERHLRIRLAPIAARARILDLWKNLGWSWGVAFFLAAALHWLRQHGDAMSFTPLALVLMVGVGGTGLSFFRFTRFSLNYKEIAWRLVEKHPEVRSLVMTAVEQKSDETSGQLNYLQERLLREAIIHAKSNQWIQTISSQRLLYTASFSLWMGIGYLFFLYQVITQELPVTVAQSAPVPVPETKPLATEYMVNVEPGNTEIEKGSGLVVMARFGDAVPETAVLVLGEESGYPLRLPMSRNLGDPIFGVRIPEVSSETTYRVEFADGESQSYRISVYEHPALLMADAVVTNPLYSRLPGKEYKDVRSLSMPEGAVVQYTFTLNKPVMGAWLTPEDGDAIRLEADQSGDNIYTTSLSPTESLRCQLDLQDDDGRRNKLPPRFSIDILPNQPAKLKVLFPRGDRRVSPLEEIEFEAEVSDDFGVGAYGLTYSLPGVDTKELVLGHPGQEPSFKVKVQHMLALEPLNVEPDQLLTWHFWAEDRGPDGKVRRHEGDMYFAEVRPFEEIYRQGMPQEGEEIPGQEKKQIAEKLANDQKLIISATWKLKRQADQAIPKTYLQDVELVRQSQAQVLQESEEAMDQLDDPEAEEILGKAVEFMENAMQDLEIAVAKESAQPLASALTAEQKAYSQLLKLRAREFVVSQSQGKGQGQSSSSQRNQEQLDNLDIRKQEQRYETANQNQREQDVEKREDRQALSRLKELAQRQNDLAEKLKDLQIALEEAITADERNELQRQLKRLREEQRNMVSDLDELHQRVQKPENRERNQQARNQLDKTREKMTKASEALREQNLEKAINSSTKAQRDLEELEDDFRKKVANRFSEEMRKMRSDARQLDDSQKQLASDLRKKKESKGRRLVDDAVDRNLAQRAEQQKSQTSELLKQMKEVTEQSEDSEPLLSRKLYESLRKNASGQLEKSLQNTSELLKRSFLPQASEALQVADKGIAVLREDVEDAAKSVLGDPRESLRRAKQELEALQKNVQDELIRKKTESGKSNTEENELRNPQNDEGPDGLTNIAEGSSNNRLASKTSRELGPEASGSDAVQQNPLDSQSNRQNQPLPQQTSESGEGENSGQPSNSQKSSGEPQHFSETEKSENHQVNNQGQTGQLPENLGSPQANSHSSSQDGRVADQNTADQSGPPQKSQPQRGQSGNQNPFESFGGNTGGPMTGRNYLQWSDRLRDVEEMVESEELRNKVAAIRDKARSFRREFKRHGKEPEWDLVSKEILEPLAEVHGQVREELLKLESEDSPVPIDRDPVPERFSDLIEKYYKELGRGE